MTSRSRTAPAGERGTSKLHVPFFHNGGVLLHRVGQVWHEGCTEGKLRAVMALCVLAEGHQENKSEIGTVGGIPVLIRLQNDKLPQMKMWSMRALSNLATDHKENDECIAAAGGTVLPSLGGMKITAVPDDAVASVDALRLNSVGTQVNKHEASS